MCEEEVDDHSTTPKRSSRLTCSHIRRARKERASRGSVCGRTRATICNQLRTS